MCTMWLASDIMCLDLHLNSTFVGEIRRINQLRTSQALLVRLLSDENTGIAVTGVFPWASSFYHFLSRRQIKKWPNSFGISDRSSGLILVPKAPGIRVERGAGATVGTDNRSLFWTIWFLPSSNCAQSKLVLSSSRH